ncbi:Peptidyl-prolyl cis-trans isomerase PpiD [hydrothermal vent metagenome]|uniref:Periplasmic chaperone PpiD n=1 Tax=hydrothermal vent metagenome TaxID=652676 RepID=A0A3B0R9T7_9ZZZZ
MLTAMRGATGGIIAKTFLVLLAGSFAVWGVADVFTGPNDQVLAKIGKREVSALEFRRFFDQRLQQLNRTSGQLVTMQQARQIGLDRQLLGDMLRSATLDEQASKLKMSLSDDFVAKQVADNPAYKDANGNFSAGSLQQSLYNAGVTEEQFISNERNNLLRSTITAAISEGLEAPKMLVRLMAEQASEKRDASYFTISAEGIDVGEPTDKQIEEFYNKNKSRFAVPERRTFETLSVTSAQLGQATQISEEQLKASYERQKSRFGSPETRTIEQIPFPDVTAATTALKRIREGASFAAIAKEKGLSEKDMLFGTFRQGEVPDPLVGVAAFELKEGEVSDLVSGRISIFLIRVTKITPEVVKPLAEVRDELIKTIQSEAGRDEILSVRDKVEDERGGGAPFKEIARSLKLTYKITPAVNRAGMDDAGNLVTDIPNLQQVLQAGYESDVGFEIDPIATDDDGFVWLSVQEVVPAHIQALKDAKDKATDLWKAEQLRQALKKKAESFVQRANEGAKFEEIAKEAGVEIKKELGISRRVASAQFDGGAVLASFSVPVDKVTFSINPDGNSAKVIALSPVLAPPYDPSSAEVKEIETQLRTLVNNDVFASYMVELQKSVGVEIRQEAWTRVFQNRIPTNHQ